MQTDNVVYNRWVKIWMGRFFNSTEADFKPELEDAILHAADNRAARLLKVKLERMTLLNWSQLLLSALQDTLQGANGTPWWMSIPALSYLGFRESVLPLFEQFEKISRNNQKVADKVYSAGLDQNQIAKWAGPMQSQVESNAVTPDLIGAGIFLVAPRSSICREWKPAVNYAGILIESDKLSELKETLEFLSSIINLDNTRGIVFVEREDPSVLSIEHDKFLPEVWQSDALRVFELVQASARELDSGVPVIRDPAGLEDAMSRAISSSQESS
jgi:hypothetical protein